MSTFETMEPRCLLSSPSSSTRGNTANLPEVTALGLTQATVQTAAGQVLVTSLASTAPFPAKVTATGTLYIHGTDDRDRISVHQNTDGNIVVYINNALQATGTFTTASDHTVSITGLNDHFDASAVKRIRISGGAGRDLVTVQAPDRISSTIADSTGKDVLTRFKRNAVLDT